MEEAAQAAKDAAFDAFVVGMNLLLGLPGHALRIAVLRHLGRWQIGAGSTIERGIRLTTKGGVSIGKGCLINQGSVLDGRGGLTVGDLVNISPDVACLTADHDPDSPDFGGRYRPVTLGSKSWLGTRAIVLPGATIGEGAVVGAGSVVGGTVPPWTVVAGSPAVKVRDRSPEAQQSLPPYRRWLH